MPRLTRRDFISRAATTAVTTGAFLFSKEHRRRPNVIVVLTDDLGYGDLGCHGNDKIKTPHLDSFPKESVEFTQFYVCPICNPSRASLLTGLFHYRVGVGDSHGGGTAMMYGETVTLAEMLSAAGYRTGIFGKWHLGDNYPMRSMDHGFQESLVYRGGSIGFNEYPLGNSKLNPVLIHNGTEVRTNGYSTDVLFRAAIDFIEESKRRPFLVYLATDAPHVPLVVPEENADPYRRMGLPEGSAKLYGMITNLDDNFARLLSRLNELRLEQETIIIFLSDNGAQLQTGNVALSRFNAGLRGGKGQIYEGGIRVPFFLRWPQELGTNRKVDRVAAHIDLVPTLLDACGVEKPGASSLDGRSLMPLLRGNKVHWPERNLFFQMLQDEDPEVRRAYAVRSQKYKLVHMPGKDDAEDPVLALYDIDSDPGEERDISRDNRAVVANLHDVYKVWFRDVVAPGFKRDPSRIYLGTPHENPTILGANDQRGPKLTGRGHWDVKVVRPGIYRVDLHFAKAERDGIAQFSLGEVRLEKPFIKKATSVVIDSVKLPSGEGKLEAFLKVGELSRAVYYAEVEKIY